MKQEKTGTELTRIPLAVLKKECANFISRVRMRKFSRPLTRVFLIRDENLSDKKGLPGGVRQDVTHLGHQGELGSSWDNRSKSSTNAAT